MITISMLRRQVWMADDDAFDHIVENSQRVLKLNARFENHRYVEEFTKELSVMFIYRHTFQRGRMIQIFWGMRYGTYYK